MTEKSTGIEYAVVGVREILFTLINPEEYGEKVDLSTLRVRISMDFGLGVQHNLVGIIIDVIYEINHPKEDRYFPCMRLKSLVEFYVDGLPEIIQSDGKNPQFPGDFLSHLAGVAGNTTRGMISVRCNGSFLQNEPLPAINSKRLVEELEKRQKSGTEKNKGEK